jgi:hypothetical protein
MYKTKTIHAKIIVTAILITILLVTNACTPVYIYPTRQTVALVEKKGDLIASANIATGNNIGVGAAYGITNNVALSTQFNSYNQTRFADQSAIFPDLSWQNELIIFQNKTSGIMPALNIGFGINRLGNKNKHFSVDDKHIFLQPTLSIKILEEFSISFSGRIIGTKYNMLMQPNYADPYDIDIIRQLYDYPYNSNTIYYRFDPAITFTSHIDDLKIQFQMLYPMELNYRTYNYYLPTFGFTIGYNFANFLKK